MSRNRSITRLKNSGDQRRGRILRIGRTIRTVIQNPKSDKSLHYSLPTHGHPDIIAGGRLLKIVLSPQPKRHKVRLANINQIKWAPNHLCQMLAAATFDRNDGSRHSTNLPNSLQSKKAAPNLSVIQKQYGTRRMSRWVDLSLSRQPHKQRRIRF